MDKRIILVVFLALVVIVAGLSAPAHAILIQFEAIDLPDAPAGDLWQYRYTVSDVAFQADQGFSIEFPVGLYRDLELMPWDTKVRDVLNISDLNYAYA